MSEHLKLLHIKFTTKMYQIYCSKILYSYGSLTVNNLHILGNCYLKKKISARYLTFLNRIIRREVTQFIK